MTVTFHTFLWDFKKNSKSKLLSSKTLRTKLTCVCVCWLRKNKTTYEKLSYFADENRINKFYAFK